MARRLGVSLATVVFAACAAVAVAEAQEVKPPANDDCMACHSDPEAKREAGTSVAVNADVFAGSKHAPLSCVDCHKDLERLAEYPHPSTLEPVDCATCHDDVGAKYKDSTHARARDRAGLTDAAPSCASCHGSHDVKGRDDPASRVFRANIPATCGSCHQGIIEHYDKGVHAAAVKAGDASAPVCTDCHATHTIQRADNDAWRLSVISECGTCHGDVVESYRRTFHGKVTEMGFSRVAACADCHGAHDVLPAANPASMVSKARLVETCSKCHSGANESFVEYDPHPNPNNYQRSPLMWWVNRFYTVLIAGCFGFFGLHSLLWFRRTWRWGGGQSS
jgi:nitrate/TMAO reductase-like tetraheme cytochrome c subunit